MLKSRAVDKTTGLRCDQTIRLSTWKGKHDYPKPLRRISHVDTKTVKRLVFLTNNFELPALTIAAIYKSRWQIELFFKWIKQNLRIKAFFGITENAVRTQIWIALCVYLMGLPRPHTAKRLLFEAASLGVSRIDFFEAEKGEPSYARSSLWLDDGWRERLRLGAEQSFGTHLPEVAMYPDLQTALSAQNPQAARLAMDNYEAAASLGEQIPAEATEVVLALGPERGWSSGERDTLQRNGWQLAHLGPFVLRSETAAVAAVSVAATALSLWTVPSSTRL